MRSKLKVVLADKEITQTELADKLGVSQATVWRWTKWEEMRDMSVGRLLEVAELLGCEVTDLFEE